MIRLCVRYASDANCQSPLVRGVSTASAIARGIGRSGAILERTPRSHKQPRQFFDSPSGSNTKQGHKPFRSPSESSRRFERDFARSSDRYSRGAFQTRDSRGPSRGVPDRPPIENNRQNALKLDRRPPRTSSKDSYGLGVKPTWSKPEIQENSRFGNCQDEHPRAAHRRQLSQRSPRPASEDGSSSRSQGRMKRDDRTQTRERKSLSEADGAPNSSKTGKYRAQDSSSSSRHRDNLPVSIPYTTPASEFLYGQSVIRAALQAEKRKLYKLYFNNAVEKTKSSRLTAEEPLIKLAYAKNVEVKILRQENAGRLLDAMSGGRPHNGYVLEASPLPKLSCTSLEEVDLGTGCFKIKRAEESDEDFVINGATSKLRFDSDSSRHPFLLFLDGILDPGNLGAVFRSAFFLGVDAVVISSHGSPLTSAALKASAGAAEMLPILSVYDTGHFIRSSQRHGWQFYAAVPLPDGSDRQSKPIFTPASLNAPLARSPSVLMLGGEGTGLWKDLQWKSDHYVTIPGPRAGQAGVDSLNVSVAAALLTEAFMRPVSSPSSSEVRS